MSMTFTIPEIELRRAALVEAEKAEDAWGEVLDLVETYADWGCQRRCLPGMDRHSHYRFRPGAIAFNISINAFMVPLDHYQGEGIWVPTLHVLQIPAEWLREDESAVKQMLDRLAETARRAEDDLQKSIETQHVDRERRDRALYEELKRRFEPGGG